MDFGDSLNETIQFEIPDLAGAARLARRLRPSWAVFVHERDDVALVSVALRSGTSLALLLRGVEAWVEQESLRAIRFKLDDRDYVLQAGEVDWAATPDSLGRALP
jgi:hypothetical protein